MTALIGEHVDHPADDAGRLDVGEVVSLFAEQAVGCIVTVTGRDRTMVEAQREIEHLHQVGALAVHCVTGDHPAALGIDRPATWGAECFDLIAAVVGAVAVATAGESPTSPGPRVARLIAKERAGATALILNHGGNIADLVEFADRCRDAGAVAPLIAPVPVVDDAQSAQGLGRFPGLRLPDGLLAAVAAAAKPRRVGIALAVSHAADALASGRFAGINLSGPARVSNADERLDITAELLDALREG